MFSNHASGSSAVRTRRRRATRSTCRAAAGRCRRSESCRRRRRTRRPRRSPAGSVMPAAGGRVLRLFRQRPERRRRRHPDVPSGVDLVRRAAGIETPGTTPARSDGQSSAGRCAVARRNSRPPGCRRSISSSARSCARRRSASCFSQSILGRLANGGPHLARRSPVAALRQRRRRQRLEPPGRAGHAAGLVEPRRRPRGSRARTSSARSRCPACIPIYRAVRVNPFRGAPWPDPGGRDRSDRARREKSRRSDTPR